MIQEIERLEKELEKLKAKLKVQQESCKHVWGDILYDPEEVSVPKFSNKLSGQGSDPYYALEGFETKHKDRWSKTCKLCEIKKYTSTRDYPKNSKKVPIFND